ncbi:cupin domain-containing protein [Salinispira pacifica]
MEQEAESFRLTDDGTVPNNERCPLLYYASAFPGEGAEVATAIEKRFAANGWPPAWRDGVYPYHHYHSTSHEVLGCYSGSATVQLGGESGITRDLHAGDVLLIPAGVAHKRLRASGNFAVVGAYPQGQSWDMNYCRPEERERAIANIRVVPLPELDPVQGADGALVRLWHA